MLSFFRSIRRSLINEGKTVKYIKYAVGEFLLIVAGILVALQIQTWNEGRKLDRVRLELIENLKAEFQVNLEGLMEATAIHEINVSNLTEFLRLAHADNSHLSVNELKTLSQRVGHTFTPALGTYHSARDDGSIALIDNLALAKLFIKFEQRYSSYKDSRDSVIETNSTGETMALRRRLGSLSVLSGIPRFKVPEAYSLSDQEYRDLISEKEVYSVFELFSQLYGNQVRHLGELKVITEQILAALEALD